MTSHVEGAYYRKYINHKSDCWVLYDKDHVSIKKRTMYKGDHVLCKRYNQVTIWTDTYYYPTATRDYQGLPIKSRLEEGAYYPNDMINLSEEGRLRMMKMMRENLDRLTRHLASEHAKGKESVTLGDMTFTGFAQDEFITVKTEKVNWV